MAEALDTFPRRMLHHASVRPRHPATREIRRSNADSQASPNSGVVAPTSSAVVAIGQPPLNSVDSSHLAICPR